MEWLPRFTFFGIHGGSPEEKFNVYEENYRRTVIALRDGTLDIEKVRQGRYLNNDLNAIIRRP